MADIVNIQELDPNTFDFQDYSLEDQSLVSSLNIDTSFNTETDYLEYFVYDVNGNIIFQNTSGYPNYQLLDNKISINPEANLRSTGYDEGSYNTLYNFLSNQLGSNSFTKYYIDQISSDRTELRLNSTQISSEQRIQSTNEFLQYLDSQEGAYPDFYLNFDNNQLVIANNIKLDGDTILIKLYEPLPNTFSFKSELWVVEKIAESVAYNISITPIFEIEDDNIQLKGPNLNISIKDNVNNSTEYKTYTSLSSTTNAQGSGSLQYQLNNVLAEKGIKINVDYTDYTNFVNFSSAQTRLENFYYKLSLIEEYTISSSYSTSPSSGSYYVSASNNIWQKKIDEIITGFDGYENFLYFESGSKSWPKTNSTPPYINAPTSNPGVGYNFFITQSVTASNYDLENDDALINTVPEYLRDDSNNDKYELFVEMLGQQFDNVYLYIQSITDKFDADNRLNYGISKDLVADAIRDLGVKIYQNNFSVDDLYIGLLGIDPSGSLLGLPGTTGSLPTPTGFEYIDTYVTASNTGSLYPTADVNKSIYKRIYHNLPYLLKKKGTVEGLRTLINIYGIPDTILRISEFGGKDKININDWDYWQDVYNYKFDTVADGTIETEWPLNPNWGSTDNIPHTVQFRFKMPPSSSDSLISQSLWSLDDGSEVKMVLEYDKDFTSGSYSGSIPNPENQYANLWLYTNADSSGSIRLPFFDDGWWSVMIAQQADNSLFEFYAANKIYNGKDGYEIGFIASSSVTASSPSPWTNAGNSYFPSQASIGSYTNFSGSYQEIRYFTTTLGDNTFRDYTMNPNSIEGSTFSSSQDELAFRASLGGESYTGSISIHPKITGSEIINSFISDSNFTPTEGEFTSNKEVFFYDQVPTGIKNRNTNKLKQIDTILPPTSGSYDNIPVSSSLSPFGSVQQNSYVSESYTADIDYVEVAFSPQNEINDDIISSLGYFNIGDYIGDPRQVSSSAESYPDLDRLRNEYFEKYKSNYDLWDYIRLIKYLDNSLFKMLKDFTPARSSLASGIVIKQHLLERNKYPTPQLDTHTTTSFTYLISGSGDDTLYNIPNVFQNLEITGSAIQTNNISGGAGGSVNEFNRPVGFFRITDTPNVTLNNSTFTTLLDQSPSSKFAGPNNPGITLNPSGINNGEFKNGTDFDFTTNFTFQFKNPNVPQRITMQLVEVGGGVLKEVSQYLPSFGPSVLYIYYFNNVTLKSGRSYYFRAKTSLASQVINTFDVRFFQEDAPVLLRNGQFYNVINKTPLGNITEAVGDSHEFYDGEYSGSSLIATTQSLNSQNPFLEVPTTLVNYSASISSSEYFSFSTFVGTPISNGTIQLWFDSSSLEL